MAREKIEKGQLLKDWFGRRAENAYTHKDDTNKLFKWDKHRENLSSYFIKEESAIREAAKVTGSMFRVMGIDKHIKYASPGETNMNKIKLPLGLLKEKTGVNKDGEPEMKWIENMDYEKLDAFYGAALQSAAKFSLQSRSEFEAMIKNKKNKNKTVKTAISEILNTERLDKKLASRFPGYIKFVQKFKDYTYDKIYEPLSEDASDKERLMDTIFKMLRYPSHIDEETFDEFKEPLDKIEKLLKKFGGIPETQVDCDSMATSLSNIIYKYIEEEEEPPRGGGEGEGDDEDEGGEGKPKGSSKKEIDEKAHEMLKGMMGEGESESFSEGDVGDFENEMDEETSSNCYINPDEETDGITKASSINFTKSGVDKSKYKAIRDKIDFTKAQVVRKLFERKSKSYDFSMKGMRSGRLDASKIAEAKQGVPTVYERIATVTTNKVCIGVLIDESGSMNGTRITKAREAAIFINETFKKMNDVELYIYGHTADTIGADSVDIMVYKEPGFQDDQYALGSVTSRANNRDGDAIYAVGKRMRKITENLGILFVISDGQPAASGYSGTSGIIDTRKKVSMTQRLGFQVIQIAIEEGVPSKDMFDYFVKMTNINNLPKDLSAYMSTKVDKMIKETVTV